MYEDFYHLKGKPFQLNPDPSFFYASRGHKRAMAYLQYGLYQREGFIVITGDVGAGKTTLIRSLLEQLDPTLGRGPEQRHPPGCLLRRPRIRGSRELGVERPRLALVTLALARRVFGRPGIDDLYRVIGRPLPPIDLTPTTPGGFANVEIFVGNDVDEAA